MITPDRIKNVDILTKHIQYGIIHLSSAACFSRLENSPLGNFPPGPAAFSPGIQQTDRNIALIGTGILCLAFPAAQGDVKDGSDL